MKALILYPDGRKSHIEYSTTKVKQGSASKYEDTFPPAKEFPAETIVYRPGHEDPWLRSYMRSQRPFFHMWEVIDATQVPKEHRMWQLVFL